MIKVLVSLVYFLFFLSNTEAGESIVFALDPTKPPMQFISPDGRTVGFEIDFINEMARYGGFTPVFKKVQWQSIFTGLVNDEFDAACASISITEERKEILSFTIPYYTVSQAILVSRDSDIKGVADLKGKRVGAKNGTTSSVALQKYPDITIELFPDVTGAVQVLTGKVIWLTITNSKRV